MRICLIPTPCIDPPLLHVIGSLHLFNSFCLQRKERRRRKNEGSIRRGKRKEVGELVERGNSYAYLSKVRGRKEEMEVDMETEVSIKGREMECAHHNCELYGISSSER